MLQPAGFRTSSSENLSSSVAIVCSPSCLVIELEPIAETEPDAAILPTGRLIPYAVERRSSCGRRIYCGTIQRTQAGEKMPVQETVKRIACTDGTDDPPRMV